MTQISNTADLKAAILALEKRKTVQELVIKEQFELSKKALNPVNMVKNGFSKLAETPEIRKTLVSTIIGIGLGYFTKKASAFLSEQSLNTMMSNLVDKGADRIIQRNPQSLISKGVDIARNAIKENALSGR